MDDARVWKEASSVILVAQSSDADNSSPQKKPTYLVTRRSDQHPVLPKALCFPGGTKVEADSSSEWAQLYQEHGYNVHEMEFMKPSAHLPEIYQENNNRGDSSLTRRQIPKQISLRITAIRETFEECGILLCTVSFRIEHDKSENVETNQPFNFDDDDQIKEWQERVRKNPAQFLNLCKKFSCLPNLKALIEWTNWCSPSSSVISASLRYDTMFYMAFFPHPLQFIIDPREVAYAQWMPADDIIESHERGSNFLPPPQFYEMTRLKNHSSLNHLQQIATLRQQLGLERWIPLYFSADNAFISCLPGDELYDQELVDNGLIFPEVPVMLKDPGDKSSQLHRIEIYGKKKFKAIVNIPYRFGQCYDSTRSSL